MIPEDALVCACMRKVNPHCRCDPDQLLTDCGLDSLDLATVIAMVDQELHLNSFERGIDWSMLHTVGDFLKVFHVHVPGL